MTVKQVEHIKELISRAEVQSAKAQGQIEAIEAKWKKEHGTSDVAEVEKIAEGLEAEIEKIEHKQAVLLEKIEGAADWEDVEERVM